jgi:ABC-2 type transport system permease protein
MLEQAPPSQYQAIQQILPENYNLEKVDLSSGRVPGEIDALILAAPQNLSDLDRFAVDQYLMRGGAVIALTGSYVLDLNPYSRSLNLKKVENGIAELLKHYGITVAETLVMDLQNEPFPVPVTRNIGGFAIQEIQRVNYPFFVDIRTDGMDKESPVLTNLPAVTLNWVSPLSLDSDKIAPRETTPLLRSSANSWASSDSNIQPDFGLYPELGFAEGDAGRMTRQILAASSRGSFLSFFADKDDPRRKTAASAPQEPEEEVEADADFADPAKETPQALPETPLIKKSPESARLVVVGSSEFINDTVISISQSMSQDRFLNNLAFLQNLVDWAVEDEELLAIRSRGSQARILYPISRQEQTFWEWLNYGLALLALLAVSLIGGRRFRKEKPMELLAS